MKLVKSAWLLALLIPVLSFADSSPSAKRDKALKNINAEIRSHEISTDQCKRLAADVETLREVYGEGDKSVLPTLFRVTSSGKSSSCENLGEFGDWTEALMASALARRASVGSSQSKGQRNIASTFSNLRDFYREVLLNDPVGFLTALSQSPDRDQKVIANAIAAVLKGIPDSASVAATSQLCLKTVERIEAPFLEAYFPPNTFTSRDADLQVRRYALPMYALGEKPLWPPSSEPETTYRLTYATSLPSSVITLSLAHDGQGTVTIKTTNQYRKGAKLHDLDKTRSVTPDQVARFFVQLDKANFWTTPTELPETGAAGADWIMEGVKDGQYRVIVRRCPDVERQSAEESEFAKAGRFLFEIAGYKWPNTFDPNCTRLNPYVHPRTFDGEP